MGQLKIVCAQLGPIDTNTYILMDDEIKEAIIIDPAGSPYPSIIHSTPEHFGADRSQAVIGIQMASAYVGNLAMPPLFGLMANNITPALFPFYLLALLVFMVFMHEQLVRKTSRC